MASYARLCYNASSSNPRLATPCQTLHHPLFLLKNVKAFIADDDATTRKLLHSMVSNLGLQTQAFEDGPSLLQALMAESEPSLVLLDWMMPGMSGDEVCATLVEMGMNHRFHIFMVTSLSDTDHIVKGLTSGADEYITKPVNFRELEVRLSMAQSKLEYRVSLEQQLVDLRDSLNGRYQLRQQIGQGGLGEVFEGWDSALDRPVAIKRFLPSKKLQAASDHDMWREAKITARINHPNIVTVYDCWQSPMGAFVVMELLHGETLNVLLKKQPIPLPLFAPLALHCLRGLSIAHKEGVLHCDLKPSNIFLIGDPYTCSQKVRVKVLDFGVARLIKEADSSDLEESSTTVEGSLFFISPEILAQEPLDARSDLYSIGHILYHCLAGRHAIRARNVEGVVDAHFQSHFHPLVKYRPEVPSEIREWVQSLIQRKPEDRPANADAALDSITGLLEKHATVMGYTSGQI